MSMLHAMTKAELIREIERDLEAVIFNVNLDEKTAECQCEELEDYRRSDREHMYRAKGLLDELKSRL